MFAEQFLAIFVKQASTTLVITACCITQNIQRVFWLAVLELKVHVKDFLIGCIGIESTYKEIDII